MKNKYVHLSNMDLQLIADILIQNKSKTGLEIGKGLFGGYYYQRMKINKSAFKILTKKDKEILRNPKYYPLYYGGEMARTDMIYNERIKSKLKEVV